MENHWFCLQINDFTGFGLAFFMFFESIGLQTSSWMLGMHRDIALDICDKIYFSRPQAQLSKSTFAHTMLDSWGVLFVRSFVRPSVTSQNMIFEKNFSLSCSDRKGLQKWTYGHREPVIYFLTDLKNADCVRLRSLLGSNPSDLKSCGSCINAGCKKSKINGNKCENINATSYR